MSPSGNGLNQYTNGGGATLGYDGRGNLTSSTAGGVTTTYNYNRLNLLTGSSNGANTTAMTYDSSGRLVSYSAGGSVTQMAYAGANLALERNAAGTLLRRYVFGPGDDNPIVWYEGSGTAQRRWLQGDERGSVVAVSDASGASVAINRYDEYGIPQGNTGRFQYTGQTWYGEVGLYNYKARWYSPSLGRFMQTDPIGYKDQINLYAYVGNDPVNGRDPTGTSCTIATGTNGKETASCKIDRVTEVNRKTGEISIRDATSADHKKFAKFEDAYTKATNKLLANSDKSASVSVGGKSFTTTGGELAGKLAGAQVNAVPTMNTGIATSLPGQPKLVGDDPSKTIMYVGTGGLQGLPVNGVADLGYVGNVGIQLTHDAMHAGPDSVTGLDFASDPFQGDHQTPYNQAACRLLGC